jgi:hypothetical protein
MSGSLSVEERRVSQRFLMLKGGIAEAALQFDQKLAAAEFNR